MHGQVGLLLLLLLLWISAIGAVKVKPYIRPSECKSSEYFSTLSLECVPCRQVVANVTEDDSLESRPSDRTKCVCKYGYRLELIDGKPSCRKQECDSDQVYLDGKCGICDESSVEQCQQCTDGKVLQSYVVLDSNQTIIHFKCEQCRWPSEDCTACHWSYTEPDCKCPKNYFEENGMCLKIDKVISQEKLLKYSTVNYKSSKFISQFLQDTIRGAIYSCNLYQNQTACQFLINICSLKFFTETSHDSYYSDLSLCQQLGSMNARLELNIDPYYVRERQERWPIQRYQSKEPVKMIAFHFGQNGTWIGDNELNLKQLFLCEDDNLKQDKLLFGINLEKQCKWTSKQLWNYGSNQNHNQYHELYSLSSNSELFPIAIKAAYDQYQWNFKRFFLVDSNIGVDHFNQMRPFVVYAKTVTIEIELDSDSTEGSIQPPILKIDYETLEQGSEDPIWTKLEVVFKMNDHNLKFTIHLIIIVFCSLAVLWAIFRTWVWAKRSGPDRFDLSILGAFLLNLITFVSNILIVVCLFVLINQSIVFKFQSIIHTIPLSSEQEDSIIIYLIIAYVLKTIQMLSLIMVVTNSDIFFIDWEKPRKKDLAEVHSKSADPKETPAKRSEASASSLRTKQPESVSNVTIWRSYFVTNEWSELMEYRRINISVHTLLMILFLEGTNFKNLTKFAPSGTEYSSEIPDSTSARIALASTFFILLSLIQFCYQKYIRESFGSSNLNEFIDLCSVCNISVFCWKHDKYGFYLHGLSPNGRSDVNMLEMYRMLEMEESDLCAKRGLLLNSEQQTFEMCLPISVHDQWRTLRKSLGQTRFGQSRDVDKEKIVHIYLNINKFLINFIEHTFTKADYIVQDRSVIESLLDFESYPIREKGTFFNDNGHSFENVLQIGIEGTLITFELMTFLIIDLICDNFIASAIGTYLISKLIKYFFLKMYRKNLVHKTLIDERFLM